MDYVHAIYPLPLLLIIIFLSYLFALLFLIEIWPKLTFISPSGSIPHITPNTLLSYVF